MHATQEPRIGQLMFDIAGLTLSDEDRELLAQPELGGLILFSRNYQSPAQLVSLIKEIRAIKKDCLISVDHEGGRVQRFRTEFTHLPAMAKLGGLYHSDPERALDLARECGWLMAAELRCCDVDFSFAPVLDRDYGISAVIGDRAFSSEPEVLIQLAQAFTEGMREAGMAATGKHFPGHGAVAADSHVAIPVDPRDEADVFQNDILVFDALIRGGLEAIMPAHVIYSAVDSHPAGFSDYWLKQVLRQKLGFDGVIFSDDLSMEGASTAGTFAQRAEAALVAGCDMVLVCNHRAGAKDVLAHLQSRNDTTPLAVNRRLRRMLGKPCADKQTLVQLQASPRATKVRQMISAL